MIILCSHSKKKIQRNVRSITMSRDRKKVLSKRSKKEEKVSCLVGSVSMGYTNLRHL
jgi:hypothetical protein